MSSPTSRTQKHLRDRGYHVANCERKLPATARGWRGPLLTQDLYGFIDTLAVDAFGVLAVQSTTDTHHNARKKKAIASPSFALLSRHFRIEIWSWAKRGARGKRKLWTLRRESLTHDQPMTL
jgi:hypothetical protein